MTTKIKREKTVKWGEEPKIGWMEAMYLPAVMSGVATAVRHALSGKPMTRQYPEVEPEIPANYRGVHRLNRDEEGRVKCVACYMCQTACPANCIEIIAAPAPKDDPHWQNRDKYPATFTIDELRCIYCGMCEEACPVDAILGANKRMHTIIAIECSGCELCIAPCPVDCIVMVPDSALHGSSRGPIDANEARHFRQRYDAHVARAEQRRESQSAKIEAKRDDLSPPG